MKTPTSALAAVCASAFILSSIASRASAQDASEDAAGIRVIDACIPAPGALVDIPDPDRDKDGIANELDACPNEPGPASTVSAERNGCPKALIRGAEIRLLGRVRFAKGGRALLRGSYNDELLGAILELLNAHPEIVKVRIVVQADDDAGPARARSVVEWLVKQGAKATRLASDGERRSLSSDGPHVELHIEETWGQASAISTGR